MSSYSPFQLAVKYCRHYLFSANGKGHGTHSPFVYDFIRNVLNDKKAVEVYPKIESLRKRLLRSNALVEMQDLGAGATTRPSSRRVASIAARSAKPPRLAQLLFRIARYYQSRYILELGASLGISTAYLASADPHSAVVTGEGSGNIASLAMDHFKELGLTNIRMTIGNFDDTLPAMAGMLPAIDMAFIDGNHREAPTLRYFSQLLPRMSESSIMIFDDIHWSKEMESAWMRIKDHPSVMTTVDIFFMGIIFFRPEFKAKQHFTIRH